MDDVASKIRQKLEAEIAVLEHELKHELPKELSKARAHGDLSENAEYKFAKERQDYVTARLAQLAKRLADISLLNLTKIPRDAAGYGSRVVLLDLEKQAEVTYRLVTPEEADVAQGLISTSSPIGRSLLGRRAGDTVKVQTPAGPREFEIVGLSTIYDE